MLHAGGKEAVDIYNILIKKIWTTEKWSLDWKFLQEVIVSRKTSRNLLECFALHGHFVSMIINPP